jgi:hypothetical protein
MAHEHGPHECYCPLCNYEIEVEAYQKCNQLSCPLDGTRMRAVETGELRGIGQTVSFSAFWPIFTASLLSGLILTMLRNKLK